MNGFSRLNRVLVNLESADHPVVFLLNESLAEFSSDTHIQMIAKQYIKLIINSQ